MDHISATKTNHIEERENISGARVFDGEDQGEFTSWMHWYLSLVFVWMFLTCLFCNYQAWEIDTKCNSYNKKTGANNKWRN